MSQGFWGLNTTPMPQVEINEQNVEQRIPKVFPWYSVKKKKRELTLVKQLDTPQ